MPPRACVAELDLRQSSRERQQAAGQGGTSQPGKGNTEDQLAGTPRMLSHYLSAQAPWLQPPPKLRRRPQLRKLRRRPQLRKLRWGPQRRKLRQGPQRASSGGDLSCASSGGDLSGANSGGDLSCANSGGDHSGANSGGDCCASRRPEPRRRSSRAAGLSPDRCGLQAPSLELPRGGGEQRSNGSCRRRKEAASMPLVTPSGQIQPRGSV